MVPFMIEIVVLKQLKLLYTRVGTVLHGSLHNSDCGAATIEVVIYKSMHVVSCKQTPPTSKVKEHEPYICMTLHLRRKQKCTAIK